MAWIKGQSGNPAGRPGRKHLVLPSELLAIDEYTPREIRLMIAQTGRLTDIALESFLADPDRSVASKAFARTWKIAAEKGDVGRLEFLLNRTIGRPQEAEDQGEGEKPENLSPEAADLLVKALRLANG